MPITTTSTVAVSSDCDGAFEEPNRRRRRSWPATAAASLTPTATTCGRSSSRHSTATLPYYARPGWQLEGYRAGMEEPGLGPSTIDRRLSTVCSFYRFAHIDG